MLRNKGVKKIIFSLIVLLFLGGAVIFNFSKSAYAQGTDNLGINTVGNTIHLSSSTPMSVATRVINIILGLLSLIVVVIIIYAGYLWMTSNGNEERIAEAKRILKNALIGLVIILCAWGIVVFILKLLYGATYNQNCTPGVDCPADCVVWHQGCPIVSCGTNGHCDNSACALLGETCEPNIDGHGNCGCISETPCGNKQGDGSCAITAPCQDPSNYTCKSNDSNICTCQLNPLCRGYGSSCKNDNGQADNSLCCSNLKLKCDTNSLTCIGPPVITNVSPIGGYCQASTSLPCLPSHNVIQGSGLINQDCIINQTADYGPCNISTPNGAPGNLFTINGYNFGPKPTIGPFAATKDNFWGQIKTALTKFVLLFKAEAQVTLGTSTVLFNGLEANSTKGLDATCQQKSWSDNQIIVRVPTGVSQGPIKVINDQNLSGTTQDSNIPDFVPNSIIRPGLCAVVPEDGFYNATITYWGLNLKKVDTAAFGNQLQNVISLYNAQNDISGLANVPNLDNGLTNTFVKSGLVISNYINFKKDQDPPRGPSISGFDPQAGPWGQYVTIRGIGFGSQRIPGESHVYFGNESHEASYDFPDQCLNALWTDKQIIVKVPANLATDSYNIIVQVPSIIGPLSATSTKQFEVNPSLSLSPGACKIEPNFGPTSTPIEIWGEYFDPNSKIQFTAAKPSNPITPGKDKSAETLVSTVPSDTIAGPDQVTILKQATSGDPLYDLSSNSLNFTVGSCIKDADCNIGTNASLFCCPLGSPNKGQCVSDYLSGCFSKIPNSVFEWVFNSSNISCNAATTPGVCTPIQNCPKGQTCVGTYCYCRPCSSYKNLADCKLGTSCCWSGDEKTGSCQGTSGSSCQDSQGYCTTNCPSPFSCNYVMKQAGYCQNSCPNVPGTCSGTTNIKTTGDCGDDACLNISDCQKYKDNNKGVDVCKYEPTLNKCVSYYDVGTYTFPVSCSLNNQIVTYNITDKITATTTAICTNNADWWGSHWLAIIPGNQICKPGTINIVGPTGNTTINFKGVYWKRENNKTYCLDDNPDSQATCVQCLAGSSCVPKFDQYIKDSGFSLHQGCNTNTKACGGICVADNPICPNGSTCDTTSTDSNYNKCINNLGPECDCCCHKDQNQPSPPANPASNPECCLPLTCQKSCGSGDTNLGVCSGCMNVGTTQSQHDAACNCAGHSGQFCKDDGQGGYCTDCTKNTASKDCSVHASVCCWDDKESNGSGLCRGGDGTIITNNTNNTDYGHCAYYSCSGDQDKECAGSPPTPARYNLATDYTLFNTTACSSCSLTQKCRENSSDINNCKAFGGCCWTTSGDEGFGWCRAGSRNQNGNCIFYQCTNNSCSPETGIDPSDNPEVSDTLQECNAKCLSSNSNNDCIVASKCQPSICGNPYKCLISKDPYTAAGAGVSADGTSDTNCGICCCDPIHANGTDNCKDIDPSLHCQANEGKCTGAGRGLCCGCQKDNQCGATDSMGCGASPNNCCLARPNIVAASTTPTGLNSDAGHGVCRNAILSVTFDTLMDQTSLTNNFLLLEKTSASSCPGNNSIITITLNQPVKNVFARAYNWVIKLFYHSANIIARALNLRSIALADINSNPDVNHLGGNYCAVSGSVSADELPGPTSEAAATRANFSPLNILDPDADYLGVIVGQENLDNQNATTSIIIGDHLGERQTVRGGLSIMGVGLNAAGTYNFVDGSYSANTTSWPHSFIWAFHTLPDNIGDNTGGICAIDHVKVLPKDYLFSDNTNSIQENDTNAHNSTFDTVADRDKVYSAQTIAANGNIIQPVPGYSWDWQWTLSNNLSMDMTANVNDNDQPWSTTGDKIMVSIPGNIGDKASAESITAKVNMDNSPPRANFMWDGDQKFATVAATIFICNLPWPNKNNDGSWYPAQDTNICDVGSSNCYNFNYEIYYCRDKGNLPALIKSPTGPGTINLTAAERSVCSNNPVVECSPSQTLPAGCGYCIPEVLKQSYLFYKTAAQCIPDCAGKTCGDDGCQGNCGTCSDGQTCSNGNCTCASGGAGTQQDPYVICTADDLNNVRNHLGYDYQQGANIDLTGVNWTPIGTFTGNYNGSDYNISNLTINSSDSNVGLFSIISGANLNNINLNDVNIIVTNNYSAAVGGLAGKSYSSNITNCNVSGSITSSQGGSGLISYVSSSTISHCSSAATVSTNNNSNGANGGGMFATIDHSIVSSCVVTGSMFANCNDGGLANSAVNSTISNSYVTGAVTGASCQTGTNAGGFLGSISNSTVSNCYSAGNVTSGNNVGGFLASDSGGNNFNNNFYDTSASGQNDSNGATPEDTTWMTSGDNNSNNFINIGSWNFTNIWTKTSGHYPTLK